MKITSVRIASDTGIVDLGEATPDIGFFGVTLDEEKVRRHASEERNA